MTRLAWKAVSVHQGSDGGMTRRAALLTGVGVLAVAGSVAAGVDRLTADRLPPGVPHDKPGALVSGSFVSARRGGLRTGWSVAYPPGAPHRKLPVLVVLHGRGGDHRSAFAGLHLDRYLARTVRQGSAPFAVATVDGGDHSYWHPRRGDDAAAMVVEEFLPVLAARDLDVRRIGLLGWSMGGYGALYLGTQLRRPRICVLIAESPALWQHSWQSAAGAFDDAADFDAHTVLGRQHRLAGIPLRIDCGASDGFAPITRELQATLTPPPAGGIEPGGHDEAYWRSQALAQLEFAARHLAA